MRKLILTIIWSLFGLLVVLTAAAFALIKVGWLGYMPPLDELQRPISRYASQVLTADGKVIGTWSLGENRVFVDYDSISPYVFQALVATEDVRFYEHSGIDVRALGRAVVGRGLLRRKAAGGGSTITQQLAKQLYSSTAASTSGRLMQKPVEWVIATELERLYTKEEILTLYLNYFDFLHNAVGIKTAAQVYFGKSPRDLTLSEAATLVGMCKNPSYFNPVREPERCRQRRNVVLHQMVKAGCLSEGEYDAVAQSELGLNFHRVDHKDGTAAYLREYLRRIMMAKKPERRDYTTANLYYADSLAWETDPLYGWCRKNRKKDGSSYDLYVDGLKVYTAIDSRMQRYAEEAVRRHVGNYLQREFNKEQEGQPNFPYNASATRGDVERALKRAMRQSERYRTMKQAGATDEEIEQAFRRPVDMTVFSYQGERDVRMTPMDSIRYYKAFLRAGLLSMDPATGYVKAYVGGPDYTHFQYDMAMVGRRQIGSTMKPFVYAMAMEDGWTPSSTVLNVQRSYGNWTPRNGSRARYGQQVTLKWGLSQSNNWVTAALMAQIDPRGTRLVDLLKTFGVANNEIYPSMPLCLGACEITVGEMASAYTAFVNKGIRVAPILVTRIEDNQGNVIADFTPRMNEVLSEETSYKMLDMLQAVIDQGTGRRLRSKYNLTGPIAGKTGTTNDNSDGWFMGLVPRLVTACWVGGEERTIHFNSMQMGQGSSSALPIWAYFMTKVYNDRLLGYSQTEDFAIPRPAPRVTTETTDDDAAAEAQRAAEEEHRRADSFFE
jgi:penicillin-binding protein 1A